MNGSFFIDSNVFLYALAQEAGEKGARAAFWLRILLASGQGMANLQVMNEVTNVLIKRARMPAEAVFAAIDSFSSFGMQPVGKETVSAARLLHFRYGYSWWDCLLLAAAIELGCRFFLSEDLQNRQEIGGLTIVDPFRHTPADFAFH
jgi:predicted nucleic acid-binding protein